MAEFIRGENLFGFLKEFTPHIRDLKITAWFGRDNNLSGHHIRTYIGLKNDFNTRILPTPGEKRSGYMIRLNGSGKLTHPDCITINTQSPADYYGYIHMHNKPVTGSIVLKINNSVVPESLTNGWEYIGYKSSQNIKVKSPSEPHLPGYPAINKTGHFLKLHGSFLQVQTVCTDLL